MNIHNTLPGYDDLDDVTVHSGSALTREPNATDVVLLMVAYWQVPLAEARDRLARMDFASVAL